MRHTIRVAAGLGILVAGCTLAACASTPATPDDLEANASSTSTSSTTATTTLPEVTMSASAPATTVAGVVVPNVIGMKPSQARLVMRSLGFVLVPFNTLCNKGTAQSQSVLSSLSVPGPGQDARVGATPLAPGSSRPARSLVGVTWSGCYPNGTTVPDVTGLSFDKAVRRLHLAGLAWACYSVPATHPNHTTTTTTLSDRSKAHPPHDASTTTTTTTTKDPDTLTNSTEAGQAPDTSIVLSQDTKPRTLLKAHTAVDLAMRHCPQ